MACQPRPTDECSKSIFTETKAKKKTEFPLSACFAWPTQEDLGGNIEWRGRVVQRVARLS
jgi:hypothetical protein